MRAPEFFKEEIAFIKQFIISPFKHFLKVILLNYARFCLFLFIAIPYLCWWFENTNGGGFIWGLVMIGYFSYYSLKGLDKDE